MKRGGERERERMREKERQMEGEREEMMKRGFFGLLDKRTRFMVRGIALLMRMMSKKVPMKLMLESPMACDLK